MCGRTWDRFYGFEEVIFNFFYRAPVPGQIPPNDLQVFQKEVPQFRAMNRSILKSSYIWMREQVGL